MYFLTSPKQRFTLCPDIEKGQCKVGGGPFRNVETDALPSGSKETVTDAPPPQSSVPPSIHFHLEQSLLPEEL